MCIWVSTNPNCSRGRQVTRRLTNWWRSGWLIRVSPTLSNFQISSASRPENKRRSSSYASNSERPILVHFNLIDFRNNWPRMWIKCVIIQWQTSRPSAKSSCIIPKRTRQAPRRQESIRFLPTIPISWIIAFWRSRPVRILNGYKRIQRTATINGHSGKQ